MPTIQVTVRDGRAGRDPAKVTPDGGEVFAEFEHGSPPFKAGDRLALPDGGPVKVIGVDQALGPGGWKQTVHVGNVPDA
jgi:hypothetical protein